jgi:hypothetical protein
MNNMRLLCISSSFCGDWGECRERAKVRFVCDDNTTVTVKAQFHHNLKDLPDRFALYVALTIDIKHQ